MVKVLGIEVIVFLGFRFENFLRVSIDPITVSPYKLSIVLALMSPHFVAVGLGFSGISRKACISKPEYSGVARNLYQWRHNPYTPLCC